MPLSVKDGIKTWIDDFKKSDDPKFDGKSAEKRRDMAIAAYMSAKNESVQEALLPTKDVEKVLGPGAKPIKNVKNSDGTTTSPMSRAKQLAKKARDVQKNEDVEENNNAPQTAAHRRAMLGLPKKVKLKGFGPDGAKGNMGNASARAALKVKKESVELIEREDTAHHVAKTLIQMGVRHDTPEHEVLKKIPHALKKHGLAGNKNIQMDRDFHGDVFDSLDSLHKKKESVELDEAHAYSKAANALRDYANKHGGMDKKDFHTAAKHLDNVGKAGIMQKGQHLAKMNAHFKGLDTDVRDRIHITLRQHGVMESVQEIFKSYSSMPGKRQIGRASDEPSYIPKYTALGNPRSKAAYKGTKNKVPTKKDEAVQVDELKKSTLGSYVKKAAQDAGAKAYSAAQKAMSNPDQSGKDYVKSVKRQKGIAKATDKLTKEAKLNELSPELKQRAYDKRHDQMIKKWDDWGRSRKKRDYGKSHAAADKALDRDKLAGKGGEKTHDLYKRSLGKHANLDKDGIVAASPNSPGEKFKTYQKSGGKKSYGQYQASQNRKSSSKNEAKLDEVSAKKLTNYIGLSKDKKGNIQKTGAAGSLEKSLKKSADAFRSGDKEARRAATKTANKRAKGLQMARAKLDKKVGAGSRAKVSATEAKSFDQKFKDHLKFATSKSPAVRAYMKKRSAEKDAAHAKQDPKAVKLNYGRGVLVPGRAYNAATKRGMSPRDAADAVSTTFGNRRKNGKLPG